MVALKTATELSIALRYKLRMMGVPIENPIHIRGDNMSVITNASVPKSMLKKKSQSIAYHFIRETAARKVIYVTYEPSTTNLSDALTKIQSAAVRDRLIEKILF